MNRLQTGARLLLVLFFLGLSTALSAQTNRVDLPGTIQSALGGSDWTPSSEFTRMEDQGNGIWEFVAAFPTGSYEYKVAVNGTWDVNYGKDGAAGGDNIPLVIKAKGTIVKFVFDDNAKTIFDSVNNPTQVKAPASVPPRKALTSAPVKSVPGFAFLDGADRIRVRLSTPTAPEAVAQMAQVNLDGKALAVFTVKPAGVAGKDAADPEKIVLPGTIQAALGGSEWDPNGDVTRMWDTAPGLYEFIARFPKGQFEYKVAKGGTWENNWGKDGKPGGDNLALDVTLDGTIVRFTFDASTKLILDSLNNPGQVKAPDSVPPPHTFAPTKAAPAQTVDVILGRKLGLDDLSRPLTMVIGDKDYMVYARDVLTDPAYFRSGDDWGSRWTAQSTTFRVWTPVSDNVKVELFDGPTGGTATSVDLTRDSTGTWSALVSGDLHGKFYQYRYHSYGRDHVAADISSFSASLDGKRSQVVDLTRTNPANWAADRSPALPKTTDAILYEMHTRDFTIDPSSGVTPELRGTYLGLAQRGTTVPGTKAKTGLDYLSTLGITDIHLLPVQKFNPGNNSAYNWGYETNLFNVPDSRYGTSPADGLKTIGEFKTMVQGIHAAGIRLVLDVVYNHTVPAAGDASAFDASVPYYWFRTDDSGHVLNESGVGNAVNDERPMVRQYIKNSLVYWLNEYKVDGFRFDLVGMFTKETVQELTRAVRALRPDAVLYGEPWTGGGPTRFGKGAQKGLDFAVFNDNYRNAIRGDLDGTRKGFALGGSAARVEIQRGLAGSFDFGGSIKDFAASPRETINYVSAHDNSALWDKVDKTLSGADTGTKARVVNLAGALVLLAQGIPFLEGGAEMGRTKGGNSNSYNAGDKANRYDWIRGQDFTEVTNYYRGLIALRKKHPAFRMDDPVQVRQVLTFLPGRSAASAVIAFQLDGTKAEDSWKSILVVINGKNGPETQVLPAGTWKVAADATRAGNEVLTSVNGTLNLQPLSVQILFQD